MLELNIEVKKNIVLPNLSNLKSQTLDVFSRHKIKELKKKIIKFSINIYQLIFYERISKRKYYYFIFHFKHVNITDQKLL